LAFDLEKGVVISGDSIENCIDLFSKKFSIDKKDIEYKIIEEGKKGFLGIGSKLYKVLVKKKSNQENSDLKNSDNKNSENNKKSDKKNDNSLDDIDKLITKVESSSKDLKGYMTVSISDEGNININIYPPKGEGKEIEYDEAVEILKKNGIFKFDEIKLKETIAKATGEKTTIGKIDVKDIKDGKVEIKISPDKMKAFMKLFPPQGGKNLYFKDILEELQSQHIIYGIDEDTIKETIADEKFEEDILIASGINPVEGKDAFLEYKFKIGEKVAKENSEKVDYKNFVVNIVNVTKDQLLGEKIAPTYGEEGKNILGEILIPKPGKDIILFPGKNTYLSDDGLKIYSEINGRVDFIENKVAVFPVFEVDKDVDLNIGNIDFIGDVIVKGNVLEGFEVKASGNITVEKIIEGGILNAGGDIFCKSGVFGKGKGKITSSKSVFIKFCDDIEINALDSVYIEKEATNCHIRAGNIVDVSKTKGKIIGGQIRAGKIVHAETIGNDLGLRTEIFVGVDEQLIEKKKELSENLKLIQKNLRDLIKAEKVIKRQFDLDPEDEQLKLKWDKLKILINNSSNDKNNLDLELNEIDEKILLGKDSKVKVIKTAFAGSIIYIANDRYILKTNVEHSNFVYKDNSVTIDPYF
jgi:uncharacterized protein (DUF342 family)